MDFSPAIRAIDERIFRLRYAKRTLEMEQLMLGSEPEINQAAEISAPAAGVSPAEKAAVLQPISAPVNGSGRKSGRLKGADKRAYGDKAAKILEYLGQHPLSKSKQIAHALKYSNSATSWNLLQLSRQKQAVKTGKGSHCAWSLRGEKHPEAEPEPEESPNPGRPAADESAKPFGCNMCPARFHVKGSLLSHMRVVHHAASV